MDTKVAAMKSPVTNPTNSIMTTGGTTPPTKGTTKNETEEDFELRAPLPSDKNWWKMDYSDYSKVSHGNNNSNKEEDRPSSSPHPYKFLRPLVCRMFVACRVLQLGNEARYTGIILLYRYAAAYYSEDAEENDKTTPTNPAQPQQEQEEPLTKKRKTDAEHSSITTQTQTDDRHTQKDPKTTHTTKNETRNDDDNGNGHPRNDDTNDDNNVDEEEDHWKWVAAACLVLACKAEEEPRRLRDVINLAHMLHFGKDSHPKTKQENEMENATTLPNNHGDKIESRSKDQVLRHGEEQQPPLIDLASSSSSSTVSLDHPISGSNTTSKEELSSKSPPQQRRPSSSSTPPLQQCCKLEITNTPPELDSEYWNSKERIVAQEQAVLRMIQFDVLVSHPHRLVYVLLEDVSSDHFSLVQIAWRRLNDALFYPPALCHPVLPLACAAVCLAIEEDDQASSTTGSDHDDSNDNKNNTTKSNGGSHSSNANITKVVKDLGLDQYWLDSYKVTPEALVAAKRSLIEATSSL